MKEESQTKSPENGAPQQPAAGAPAAPATQALATVSQKFGLTLDSKGNLDLPSLGVVLAQSRFFNDITGASQGMVKVMLGRELGIPAITAVIGIHILTNRDGKVTVMIGSHLKAGKIKKSGCYDYDITEATAKRCILVPKIKNTETGKWDAKTPVEFTIEQAQRMDLGGWDGSKFKPYSNWAKAPEDMLFHRALGRMEKMHFPDISTVPTYTPDELGFREDEKGEAVIMEGQLIHDADNSRVTPTPAAEPTTDKHADPEEKKPRVKPSPTVIAKLQALSKKHKWENAQFFDMTIAEGAMLDKDAAQTALEQQNWKALTELIAGEEEIVEKMIAKLTLGPDTYLDLRSNPPLIENQDKA